MTVREALVRSTTEAAHRRDHVHPRSQGACHPHVVEVVHLGRSAMVVCHDCRQDTGFMLPRQAERTAAVHRVGTGVEDTSLDGA